MPKAMDIRFRGLQFPEETDDLRATEQVVTGAGMNLPVLELERRQVPHREIAELPPARVDQKPLGHRTEKSPAAFLAPRTQPG